MELDPSEMARVETACGAVATMIGTPAFRRRGLRLLRTPHDVRAAREGLPHGLLPFMTAQQATGTDVYALDLGRGGRVVVWNDHAIVADWASFDAFADWLRGDPATA